MDVQYSEVSHVVCFDVLTLWNDFFDAQYSYIDRAFHFDNSIVQNDIAFELQMADSMTAQGSEVYQTFCFRVKILQKGYASWLSTI